MTNLALDSGETQWNNFENLKANVFSTDTFTDNTSDSDIYISFYKKMAFKNLKNLKKMLRKSPSSNV